MTYTCEQKSGKHIAKLTLAICFAVLLLCITGAETFAQAYSIDRSVIGSGGRASNGTIVLDSVIGQPASGPVSTSGTLTLTPGFLQYDADFVSVSGRVTTSEGRGVTNALVHITGPNVDIVVLTGRLGRFTFNSIRNNQTYLITVSSRRFQFANNPRMVFVGDNVAGIDFIGTN